MISVHQFNSQIKKLQVIITKLPNVQNVQLEKSATGTFQIKAQINISSTLKTEFIITYSPNYQCPILYFRNFELLEVDEIECWKLSFSKDVLLKCLNQDATDSLQISLKEYENTSFWFIHPCDTKEILQNSNEEDYLVNWLSFYGGKSLLTLKITNVF